MDTRKGEWPTVQFAISALLGMAAAGRASVRDGCRWLLGRASVGLVALAHDKLVKGGVPSQGLSSLRLRSESQSIFQFRSIIRSC